MGFIASNFKELNYQKLIKVNGGVSTCTGDYMNEYMKTQGACGFHIKSEGYIPPTVYFGGTRNCSGSNNNRYADYYLNSNRENMSYFFN